MSIPLFIYGHTALGAGCAIVFPIVIFLLYRMHVATRREEAEAAIKPPTPPAESHQHAIQIGEAGSFHASDNEYEGQLAKIEKVHGHVQVDRNRLRPK